MSEQPSTRVQVSGKPGPKQPPPKCERCGQGILTHNCPADRTVSAVSTPAEGLDLDAIRAVHRERPPSLAAKHSWCSGCKANWPCPTARVMDEVERLREEVKQAAAKALRDAAAGIPFAAMYPDVSGYEGNAASWLRDRAQGIEGRDAT